MYNKSDVQGHSLSYSFVCKLIIHEKVPCALFYFLKSCKVVLFKTLKENHKSQKKEHKINFCNELCSLSGKICGAINLEQIYILKYVNEKSGASKDDVYNALLAKNKANELLQICTTQLIAKIHDTDYTGVKRLMDNMEQLMLAEHAVQITFHYTDAEKEQMEADCNKISAILGEMRDWVVEFVEDNCK